MGDVDDHRQEDLMAEEPKDQPAQDQHFEPGQAQERADEGGVPTSAPDPTVGPD